MARQNGIIKFKGTIGDITFYKTKDGHLAREKGGLAAKRIATDPAFQRMRENGAEFGRAGKTGKMLRTAFRTLLINSAESRMVSRLTQSMVKVIQADLVNERGSRNVIDGEVELLVGFDFNITGKLGRTLFVPFVGPIDRAIGEISASVDPFVPANMIATPSETTHYKIISAATEINFEEETFIVSSLETAIQPWHSTPVIAINHFNSVTPNSVSPLFLALGVEFYQEVNGRMYPLKNGA
ncbi:hypothetical protein [Flavobacterium sp. Arc2]|uniref:hypothetical protein n=1 Tax=Flavobacterium sp. Arc2 TaxID=3046685 RepID=UPI00352D5C15